MHNLLVHLDVDVEQVVLNILNAYVLRAFRLLSLVDPVGRNVLQYFLKEQMLTEVRSSFTYED